MYNLQNVGSKVVMDKKIIYSYNKDNISMYFIK